MGRNNFRAVCDICGFEYHRDEMQKNWKNQLVCMEDYEPKHPQLTLRPRKDRQDVKDARPEPPDPPNQHPPIQPHQMV